MEWDLDYYKGNGEIICSPMEEWDLDRMQFFKIVFRGDADTLARDCVRFRENGYEIGVVTPVDMFPRTGHVENVVCLTRKV